MAFLLCFIYRSIQQCYNRLLPHFILSTPKNSKPLHTNYAHFVLSTPKKSKSLHTNYAQTFFSISHVLNFVLAGFCKKKSQCSGQNRFTFWYGRPGLTGRCDIKVRGFCVSPPWFLCFSPSVITGELVFLIKGKGETPGAHLGLSKFLRLYPKKRTKQSK